MSDPTTEEMTSGGVDPDLEPGQVVGEYTIESKLGQGGFGAVFKATHPLIGKVVAIKVLARKFSVDPDMVARFIAEARAVNQIRHRNIIDIFSFGQLEGDGRHYYVMEYLEGETLDAMLERRGRLELAEALPILRAVARALDAAHAKGIAHRDLKPENIFLGSDDGGVWPKLLDFGIAKLMGNDSTKSKTRTGMPMGTPFYMSPEQCRGKDVDHRTDFYAFGVVAYQMLTGRYPIDGDDFMTIMMRQMNDMPEPPSRYVPTLPDGVDAAVIQLMEKDPANRPVRLRDSIEALEVAAGISSMGWDAPPSGMMAAPRRHSTPVPVASTTHPPHGAGFAATAIGTVTTTTIPPASRPRRVIMYAVGGALVLAGAVVAFALTKHDAAPPPPPPAPPVAAVTPPAPPPAQVVIPAIDAGPHRVMITIAGAPEGTEIFRDGTELGAAPGPIQLDAASEPVVLTFKADGYMVASKPIVPDGNKTLDVVLKPKPHGPAPTGKRGTNKDDIFDQVDFNQKAK